MAGEVTVSGRVEPGFEAVREAFEANFTEHGDVGAAVAVYVDGRCVVDLTGGVADPATGRPWEPDTIELVFSTTKGWVAILAHLLAQRGELDLDAPVAEVWPEFKAEGKEAIPVRWLLSHRAGLPVVDDPPSTDEVLAWDPVVAALAAQRPVWEPGTRHGYHALTYGWLVGEVLRRVTGRSVGQLVADELAGPLGLDLWIGLPESEEPRVAPLIPSPPPDPAAAAAALEQITDPGLRDLLIRSAEAWTDPGSLAVRALTLSGALGSLTGGPFIWNERRIRAAEIPAANGVTDARSLARLYAATVGEVDGVRLLEPATVQGATVEQSSGPDAVLVVPTRFGSGFFLDSPFSPLLGPGSFGHAGAGGSLGFADPDAKVGFGYVMNQMRQGLAGDPRTLGLIDALRRSLS